MASRKGNSLEIATQGFSSPDGLGISTQGFIEPIIGDIILSGTAGTIRVVNIFASGGLVISGDALLKLLSNHFASGGLVTGSNAVVSRIWQPASIGGLTLGGTAEVSSTVAFTASGNVLTGGAANVNRIFAYVSNGGNILAGGTADISKTFAHSTSGGLVTGGAADVIANLRSGIIGSGGLVTGGSAIVDVTGVVVRLGRGGAGASRRRRHVIKYDWEKRPRDDYKTPKDYWKKIEDALEKARKENNIFIHEPAGGLSLGLDSDTVVVLHDLVGPVIKIHANFDVDAETMLQVESLFTDPVAQEVIEIEDQLITDGLFETGCYKFAPGPKKRYKSAGGSAGVKFKSSKAVVEHFDKGLHRRKLEEETLLLGIDKTDARSKREDDELKLLNLL
jgi:hypothetical protein|tara:strand:- start:3264 stop:4439 length:1176 start_codon:yes stop_codon:yes gene_type:complete